MVPFVPDPQFPGHGLIVTDSGFEKSGNGPNVAPGCRCHKLAGTVYLKIARLYLVLKSLSLSEHKLKSLLLHEAFPNVPFFLSTLQHFAR